MGLSVFPIPSAGGGGGVRSKKQQVFNASGTFAVPTVSNYGGSVEVLLVGGGAGGRQANFSQSQGASGGSGGAVKNRSFEIASGNVTVTIGAGGTGGVRGGGSAPNSGGASSFGNLLTSEGGTIQGGTLSVPEGSGRGGVSDSTAQTGNLSYSFDPTPGQPGGFGFGGGGGVGGWYGTNSVGRRLTPGAAGGGDGGEGENAASGSVNVGGGGGGGGSSDGSGGNGGAGGSGVCFVTWFE